MTLSRLYVKSSQSLSVSSLSSLSSPTTARNRWPTGHGFDYFYGFIAGETSQWEPRLFENTTPIEPPHDEKYHLTEDMADKVVA